jgi:hypothetical protein
MIDINPIKIIYRRLRVKFKEDGLVHLVRELIFICWHLGWYPFFKAVRGQRQFEFEGVRLRYYCHWYNLSYTNERAVELAIFSELLKRIKPEGILEIGAVLPQYINSPHLVIDKFEKNERFQNIDIQDYRPTKKFRLIISISTLEHIGYDEEPTDTGKLDIALDVIRQSLDTGGLFMASIPIGYNPHLSLFLQEERFFDKFIYLRRINKRNDWVVTDKEKALSCNFGRPFPFGNAIAICALGNLDILYDSLRHVE